MLNASCLYTIKSKYREFSKKEKIIADFILANPTDSVHPSIEELSGKIGISEATLVRFARKLGYTSYQRFRIALATELANKSSQVYETTFNTEDDTIEIVFNNAIASLVLSKNILDRQAVIKAASLITKSKQLLIFGIGGSNIIARDAFHKFIRTGLSCSMVEDYHMQLMLASQSCKNCVALVISHTGTNIDCLAITEELLDRGCPIIVLTTNPLSPLARAGNIVLSVQVASTSIVSEAFSARVAQVVVIDALYVEIMKRLSDIGVSNLEAMRRVIGKRKTH
jgi:RpiR family carbohydrate utilization transcriptional regulator